MRTQSRPFVVEIKRSKKNPASAKADSGLGEAVPNLSKTWISPRAEGHAQVGGRARMAADTLFSKAVKAPSVGPNADGSEAERSLSPRVPGEGTRRVWISAGPDFDAPDRKVPAAAFLPSDPQSIHDLRALASGPIPDERVAVQLAEVLAVPQKVQQTSSAAGDRTGRQFPKAFPPGQRWKRRLPKACR